VVTGAAGDDPPFALLRAKLRNVVPGATSLEGPAHLPILELGAQAQPLVGKFRRQLHGHQRCALYNTF
jgi:hypothetical protein